MLINLRAKTAKAKMPKKDTACSFGWWLMAGADLL
jgi:hypothetical protein